MITSGQVSTWFQSNYFFQVGNSKKRTKGNEEEEKFTYPETDEEEEEEEKKEVVRSTKKKQGKKQKTGNEDERKINLRKRNYIDDLKFSSDDSCEEAQRHRALEVILIN